MPAMAQNDWQELRRYLYGSGIRSNYLWCSGRGIDRAYHDAATQPGGVFQLEVSLYSGVSTVWPGAGFLFGQPAGITLFSAILTAKRLAAPP